MRKTAGRPKTESNRRPKRASEHRDSGAGALRQVRRPRLLHRLKGRRRVVLLVAPAGYGKTTLARQLVAKGSVLWHRVTTEDRDPSRLLAGLVREASTIREMTSLEVGRDFERDGVFLARTLAAALAPQRGAQWIVFDDIHLLVSATESARWLRRFIEESDSRIRFVLTSRGEPPVPLTRLQLEGTIVRLDTADLAFDAEEEERFLRANRVPVRITDTRTRLRGWPAGLALLALRARQGATTSEAKNERGERRSKGDSSGRDRHRSSRLFGARPGSTPDGAQSTRLEDDLSSLFAFLAEEVFSPLPEELRWILCQASLPDTLDPALLLPLLGSKDLRALEVAIARHDLFVDEARPLAQFHPLFQSFLREQLVRDPRSARVRQKVRKMARELARHDDPLRALQILIVAGDDAAAVRQFDTLARSPAESLRLALGPIAEDLRTRTALRSPWIELHAGYEVLAARGYDEARARFRRAQVLFEERKDWLSVVDAVRGEENVAIQTGQHRPSTTRLREIVGRVPDREKTVRGLLLIQLGGLLLHAGEPKNARATLSSAESLLRAPGLEIELAEARLRRATIEYTAGRWDLYLAEAQRALALYRRRGYFRRALPLLINMASASIYLGQEDYAIALLDEAGVLQDRERLAGLDALEALLRFRALAESGRDREAEVQAEEASGKIESHGSPLASIEFSVWCGMFLRRRGDLRAAETTLGRALSLAREVDSPSWLALASMEWALVLGLEGKHAEGLRHLREAEAMTRRLGDRKELGRNLFYQACLLARETADPSQARETLRRALRVLERVDHLGVLRKEVGLARALLESRNWMGKDDPESERLIQQLAGAVKDEPFDPRVTGAPSSGSTRRPRDVGIGAKRDRVRDAPEVLIQLLGGFQAFSAGHAIPFGRRTAESLVALLALRDGQPVSRETIGEALWPGDPPAAIRNRLDVALWAARRHLEPEVGERGPYCLIQGESGWLRLDVSRVKIDVRQFAALARASRPWLRRASLDAAERAAIPRWSTRDATSARAAIEAALAIYRGDLLPLHTAHEWTEPHRVRLRELRRALILGAGRIALLTHRPVDAVESVEPLVQEDPLDEEAQRILFRALAAHGERARLVQRFRAFQKMCRKELGSEPSPETIALVRSLT